MSNANNTEVDYINMFSMYFKKAKEDCLLAGKKMLTVKWAQPADIYWAALGTVINACKAYRIYRARRIVQDTELETMWSDEIGLLNNIEMTKALENLMKCEEAAKNGTIGIADAENCLENAELLLSGILGSIPAPMRIRIGM